MLLLEDRVATLNSNGIQFKLLELNDSAIQSSFWCFELFVSDGCSVRSNFIIFGGSLFEHAR